MIDADSAGPPTSGGTIGGPASVGRARLGASGRSSRRCRAGSRPDGHPPPTSRQRLAPPARRRGLALATAGRRPGAGMPPVASWKGDEAEPIRLRADRVQTWTDGGCELGPPGRPGRGRPGRRLAPGRSGRRPDRPGRPRRRDDLPARRLRRGGRPRPRATPGRRSARSGPGSSPGAGRARRPGARRPARAGQAAPGPTRSSPGPSPTRRPRAVPPTPAGRRGRRRRPGAGLAAARRLAGPDRPPAGRGRSGPSPSGRPGAVTAEADGRPRGPAGPGRGRRAGFPTASRRMPRARPGPRRAPGRPVAADPPPLAPTRSRSGPSTRPRSSTRRPTCSRSRRRRPSPPPDTRASPPAPILPGSQRVTTIYPRGLGEIQFETLPIQPDGTQILDHPQRREHPDPVATSRGSSTSRPTAS